jgi:hypothetical protein
MVKKALEDKIVNLKIDRDKLKEIIKLKFGGSLNKFVEYTNCDDNKSIKLGDNKISFVDDYYISCFSKKNDKILMWEHYADCHNGICIGFKTRYLNGVNAIDLNLKVNSGLTTVNKVKYRKEKIKPAILSRDKLSKEDLVASFLTKSNEWNYEEEYRIILSPQMNGSKIKNIAAKYISEIYFGMRTPEKIIKETINEMRKSNFLNLDLVKLFKMEESDDCFSLLPNELNYNNYL